MSVSYFRRISSTAVVLTLLLTSLTFAAEKDEEYYELMKKFVDTFEQIERNYVKDVDRNELMEAAIQGMLVKLDQYSTYISPEDLDRFNQQVEQEFGGIGIQVNISPETKRLTVMTPLPGTPAYKSGIRAGDTIMEIEGESTEGFTIDDAVKRLKGKPGEAVKIGVLHIGGKEVEQVEVVRDIIQVSTVLGDHYNPDGQSDFMIDDEKKIGYIRLTHFSRRSAAELKDALDSLKEQGMKALILDLRFNPGGLLSQAVEISDMFVQPGVVEDDKIVSTKGRNTRERVWRSTKEGTYDGFPMTVLVNRYSASASEIVSACLQDYKRARIIGERTWGKGSVQNVIELGDGASALKLTTASYHRPSGKNIHKFKGAKESDEWGVMPDEKFEVKFTTEQLRDYLEYRRQRDVLSKEGPPESEFKDTQLSKALDYIEEQLGTAKADAGEKRPPAEAPAPKAGAAGAASAPAKKGPAPTSKAAADAPAAIRILVGYPT